MARKIVIFGTSAFGQIAYEYFTQDTDYSVVAFTINKEFIDKSELFGLPVIAFEEIEKHFPPKEFEMNIALVYNNLNRIRRKTYLEAKTKGYKLANYISSKACVWKNVDLGDNNFIFENNVIQPFVKIGSNNIFWSGNHIGHHSIIKDHNFISSHVVVSGYCNIGNSCFFGVNSTLANNLTIGDDSFIGAGSLVVKNIPEGSLIKGNPSIIDTLSTYEKFGIEK